MDLRFVQKMYQQWCDGQDGMLVRQRWYDFVILVATTQHVSDIDMLVNELSKCRWFEKGD